MNTSKNNHDKLNQGGKQVINDPKITDIVSNNQHTKPEQYEEKVDDGIRTQEQPLKQTSAGDENNKSLEAGDK